MDVANPLQNFKLVDIARCISFPFVEFGSYDAFELGDR